MIFNLVIDSVIVSPCCCYCCLITVGRVTWTLQKVEMVVRSLFKVTGLKNMEDLRNRHISSKDWRKVEKDCGISAHRVRDIWRFKLSTQLFCPEPIYLKEIRIKLINR